MDEFFCECTASALFGAFANISAKFVMYEGQTICLLARDKLINLTFNFYWLTNNSVVCYLVKINVTCERTNFPIKIGDGRKMSPFYEALKMRTKS